MSKVLSDNPDQLAKYFFLVKLGYRTILLARYTYKIKCFLCIFINSDVTLLKCAVANALSIPPGEYVRKNETQRN